MFDRTIAYGLDFVFPAGDTAIGHSLALSGEFARVIRDFLISQAREDRGALLDVGANIGAIGLPFAATKRGWQVVAIEAHRGLAGLLAANVANNQLSAVDVLHAAAGAKRCVADFPNPSLFGQANYGTVNFGAVNQPTAPVLMVTLDEVAPPTTRLIKIDVEGYEPEVLKGAQRLLHEVKPIWLVEAASHSPEQNASVAATFLDAGYRLYWFFAPFVTRRPLKGRLPLEPGTGDHNLVALPPGVSNEWDLPVLTTAGEEPPKTTGAFSYLARYGYSAAS